DESLRPETRLHGDGLLLDYTGRWRSAADVSTVRKPHQAASLEGSQAWIPNLPNEGRGGGTFHRSRSRDHSLAGDFSGGGEERGEAFICRARFGRPSSHGESSNQLSEFAEDWLKPWRAGRPRPATSGSTGEAPVAPPPRF